MKLRFFQICSMLGLSFALLFATLLSLNANASLVSTGSSIQTEQQLYTKQQVLDKLDTQELKDQLASYGVDAETVKDRVASLTPDEVNELNQKLQEEPAGAGVVGAFVFVFVVLLVTDLLCVTDVFSFMKCI